MSTNNDVNNVVTYGRLYNWYSVNDSRNIAPTGWHVSSDEEWKQLEMYLGMSQAEADRESGYYFEDDFRGTDEGGKLKESGATRWLSPNTGATNESGFCALPGGFRPYGNGGYLGMGSYAYFWTSTVRDSDYNNAWQRFLRYDNSGVGRTAGLDIPSGFSVRCVRD